MYKNFIIKKDSIIQGMLHDQTQAYFNRLRIETIKYLNHFAVIFMVFIVKKH